MKPRAKWTRKKAYTIFLTDQSRDHFWFVGKRCVYLDLPRKRKKLWKRWARKFCHYTKLKGVTIFDPYLLSYPVPEILLELFGKNTLPTTSGENCTFSRFNTIARVS